MENFRDSSNGFANLEQLRQKLEANIAKLRNALSYWQTWEAEHEGLKEEVESHPKASGKDILSFGLSLDADVLTAQGMVART